MRLKARAWHPLAVLLTACLVSAGACSSSARPEPAPPEPEEPAPFPVGALAENQFPVGQEWRYSVDWGSPASYYQAEWELREDVIAACMEAQSLTYHPMPWYYDDILSVVMNPLNEVAARTYGYHLPIYGPGLDDRTAWLASQADAHIAQLTSCRSKAVEYVDGGPVDDYVLSFDTILLSMGREMREWDATSESKELESDWSACMASKGHEYSSPVDANTAFSNASMVSAEEIAVRVSDLSCDRAVGLTAARSNFETNEFQAWLAANSDRVLTHERLLDQATTHIQERRELLDRDGYGAVLATAGDE